MSRFVSLILVVLFTVLFYGYSVMAQTPSPHTYRIKAADCIHEPAQRQLTGFRMKGKRGIVTALHGVVDCESISAVTDDTYFNDLHIREVDIERDSALLSSNELDELSIGEGFDFAQDIENFEYEDFRVIGYPIKLMKQRTLMRIPIVGITTLDHLIPLPNKRNMRIRNSPNLKISVLHIQAALQPGDSGAPVLNSQRQVIGVGNGGLKEGAVDIAWLIPIQDIEWRSTSLLDVEDELKELRNIDPELALSFSSTYPDATPSSTMLATSTPFSISTPILLGPNCDCSYDRYHCTDFVSQAAAQACYWNCGAQGKGDIHKLDLDVDNLACEEFLQARLSQPTATPQLSFRLGLTPTLIPILPTPTLILTPRSATATPVPSPTPVPSTSVPPTSTPSIDSNAYVDQTSNSKFALRETRIAEIAESGKIVYSPERTMIVGTSYIVKASIIQGHDKGELEKIVQDVKEAEGSDVVVVTESISVTWWMEAELSPENFNDFSVELLYGNYSLRQVDNASWEWSVIPLVDGQKELQLKIWLLDEKFLKQKLINDINKTVFVEVNSAYNVSKFVETQWQWFLAAASILLFILWLGNRSKNTHAKIETKSYNSVSDQAGEQLQNALLDAYRSESNLRQMVRFGMGQNLDTIAGGDNLNEIVFNLIDWADANDKTSDLVRAAYSRNSSNARMKTFVEKYFNV